MYNPELQDVTNKLQRAQLMLEKAMKMNPKTDMAKELQEGRIAIAYKEITDAMCDIDDFNTLN
jgi:hypothetical protein